MKIRKISNCPNENDSQQKSSVSVSGSRELLYLSSSLILLSASHIKLEGNEPKVYFGTR